MSRSQELKYPDVILQYSFQKMNKMRNTLWTWSMTCKFIIKSIILLSSLSKISYTDFLNPAVFTSEQLKIYNQ